MARLASSSRRACWGLWKMRGRSASLPIPPLCLRNPHSSHAYQRWQYAVLLSALVRASMHAAHWTWHLVNPVVCAVAFVVQ